MLDKIKSNHILKVIFEHLHNKKKLNIIKHNERILKKLNEEKKNFEVYDILSLFNKTFNVYIKDIDIKEINLSEKYIGNEGLKWNNRYKRIRECKI